MLKGLLSVVVLGFILSGCGAAQKSAVAVDSSFESKGSLRPLPIYEQEIGDTAGTFDEEVQALIEGRTFYKKVVGSLYGSKYNASDTSYLGGITALIGGATKSIETVVLGGVLSAGGEIIPSRYQLETQADNYFALAKVYDCMVKEIMNHPGKQDLKAKANAAARDDVATHLWRLRGNLNFRLFERQKSVSLVAVSTDKLRDALAQLNKDKLDETDPTKLNKAGNNFNILAFQKNLESELNVCAAEY